MGRFFGAALALCLMTGCQSQPEQADATVRDAWIRLSPVEGRPAAAYFTVAGGRQPDRLVAITSEKIATIELHESMSAGGMMSMRKLDGVAIPAGGTIAFTPGANHAMLFGVDPTIQPNTDVALQFRFASGLSVRATARAVAAGGDTPDAHSGH